ncbi:MAG: hypothetical protein V4731_18630 [Pseudomonadota bacterium]
MRILFQLRAAVPFRPTAAEQAPDEGRFTPLRHAGENSGAQLKLNAHELALDMRQSSREPHSP